MQLEVGKTYRLDLRGGLNVEIVGEGQDDCGETFFTINGTPWTGHFFVGITRNDPGFADIPSDWVATYDENGERLWEDESSILTQSGKEKYNLVPMRRFVDLDDALSLIRAKGFYDAAELDFIELLETMPFKELADA